MPSTASAEYLGLVNGRSSDPENQSVLSLEAGVVFGDLGAVSYQYAGLRFNAHLSRRVVVFGDVGSSEFGTAEGTPFGFGAIYHLDNQRINRKIDIAFKASYHAGDYSVSDLRFNITGRSFEVLVSGIAVEGVGGYVNFGYHRLNIDFVGQDTSKQFGFGAGLSVPIGPGEIYAGFDFIEEMTLGVGFRYFIQPREPIVQPEDEAETDAESEGGDEATSESESESENTEN